MASGVTGPIVAGKSVVGGLACGGMGPWNTGGASAIYFCARVNVVAGPIVPLKRVGNVYFFGGSANCPWWVGCQVGLLTPCGGFTLYCYATMNDPCPRFHVSSSGHIPAGSCVWLCAMAIYFYWDVARCIVRCWHTCGPTAWGPHEQMGR